MRAMPMDVSANDGVRPEVHPLSVVFRMSVTKAANGQSCVYAVLLGYGQDRFSLIFLGRQQTEAEVCGDVLRAHLTTTKGYYHV